MITTDYKGARALRDLWHLLLKSSNHSIVMKFRISPNPQGHRLHNETDAELRARMASTVYTIVSWDESMPW